MRVVLDTNIALSGLLWDGSPARLIDAAIEGRLMLISSVALLAEFDEVVRRPKFAKPLAQRGFDVQAFVAGYAALVTLVEPEPIEPVIRRDPDDDLVLATAAAGAAEFIVSGDRDLLELGVWREIRIVKASALEVAITS